MLRFIGVYDYTVILTYMSLFFAVLGMNRASMGAIPSAVLCLMACGICDAFDGTVARTKKNRTEDEKAFGIQLDSLCDVISFGVFPAFLCYHVGLNGPVGIAVMFGYCTCAVIRLAFFNVLEGKRQQTESGSNKTYRGLPVTSSSMIFPFFFLFHRFLPAGVFTALIGVVLAVTAFLFILDFSVKKPNWDKLFKKK